MAVLLSASSRPSGRVSSPRRRGLQGAVAVVCLLAACGPLPEYYEGGPVPMIASTYERVVEEAEKGDPAWENLAGWMLFTGEAAPLNRDAAIDWFERASLDDYAVADLNLALAYSLGAGVARDRKSAEHHFDRAVASTRRPEGLHLSSLGLYVEQACAPEPVEHTTGKQAYETFCSGCHGVNGIARFGHSPSFALGERIEKGRGALVATVLTGHGEMPSWEDKLPQPWLIAAVDYVHTLQGQFRFGTVHVLNPRPELSFSFGPMSADFGMPPIDPSVGYGGFEPSLEEFCALR